MSGKLVHSPGLKLLIFLVIAPFLLNNCISRGSEATQIILTNTPRSTATEVLVDTVSPTPVEPTLPPQVSTPTSSMPLSCSDMGLIAFASDLDGDFEIWVMNSDGSEQRQLTENEYMDTSPSWSPDGNRIAFVSNRDGNDEVYLMNADGTNVQRLTDTEASESFPAFSPDGTAISFDSDLAGNWDIYVMAVDGSETRRLTDHPAEDWISSWSPDGNQIVFESKRDGNFEIYAMDTYGGNLQRLTDNQIQDGFPALSPDGSQIAFLSEQENNYEIYTMNADGSSQRRITDHPAEDSDPAWSPDGHWLTFVSHRDGNAEIYVTTTDGDIVYQLTDNGAQNWSPVWQPSAGLSGDEITWIRKFEGPDYGALFDLLLTPDGNVLAVGATNHLHMPPYSGDLLVMKVSLDGEVLWERTWGGDGYEQAWAVATNPDGGYYIFGETDSYGAGGRDFLLLKIAEDGHEEWFKTYGNASREWPYGMLTLSNGEFLIYGFTESISTGERNQYALRLDPEGEVVWEYMLESTEEELVLDAVETPQGDLVLAALIGEDGKLVSLDRDGNVLWSHRYELPGWQYASQIEQTPDGGFFLAGFSMGQGSSREADIWLARCSPGGELSWERSFGNPGEDDYAISMIRLIDGSYLLGEIGNGMRLSRLDENGIVSDRHSLLGQDVHGAAGLIELEDGSFLVAGFIQLVNGRSYDAILLRTTPMRTE